MVFELFHLYGLMIGLGILTGLFFVEKAQKKLQKYYSKYAEIDLERILGWIIIPALVGARIYHVVDYWEFYRQNLFEIFKVWNGGMGIWGGIIGGIIGVYFFSKIKKINILLALDLVSFGLPIGQAIGRLGNFFNKELFGKPTNLPWGIKIEEQLRPEKYVEFEKFHPLFFYEAIASLIVFLMFFYLVQKQRRKGFFVSFYFICYGTIRFFLDFFRVRNWEIQGLGVSQMMSLVFLGIGLFGLIYKQKAKKT